MGLARWTFHNLLLVSKSNQRYEEESFLLSVSFCSGIITCISVYRCKSSIYEYLAAGSITGALYKMSLGLRGMAAGGIIGGALGGVAGATSLLLMKASGTSMEEVRYWQYKWRVQRDDTIGEAFRNEAKKNAPDLFTAHDNRVGEKISLDSVK